MKVSAIIPVYKVETYVERCVRSLMEQTLQDVEFIFVDDASPDGSMDIVRRLTAEYGREVHILVHEKNKGLPAARNTGLAAAKGEYIYHCDSDDFLEKTMLEEMVRAAEAASADYVYCDYCLDFGTGARALQNPSFSEAGTMLAEGFLSGAMKFNVWNKLVRRDCYEGISFPEGHSMGEDMTMIMLAARSSRPVRVDKALYHYNAANQNALTSSMSPEKLSDIRFNVERTLAFLSGEDIPDKESYLAFFKLNVKLPFLFSGDRGQYRLWKEWYPEANPYIMKNRFQPMRTRLVQLLAKWGLFPLVSLYGWAVEHLFYSLLYRK